MDIAIAIAFGKVLRSHRKAKGLSQEQLAFQCNLDRTFIGLLERGQRQPTITTIFTISEQLDIVPHTLIKVVEELLKEK